MRAIRVDILTRGLQRLGDSLIRQISHRDSGFTLIELVIVLAVLGALSAVAIPQLTGIEDEAELRAVATTASSEINNAFARDLTAGVAGEPSGGTGVDWSGGGNSCRSVSIWGEKTPDLNAGLLFDSLVGFKIVVNSQTAPSNSVPITIPTYVSGVVGSSQDCYVVRE